MKRQQCVNCVFSSWYHNFKDITIKSCILKLPKEFVNYLKEDGVILPEPQSVQYSNDLERYSDDDDDGWEEDSTPLPIFPDLKEQVENVIKEMNGSVFPKLNWSSPRDAAWITTSSSLKCSNFNDVCLLLKSSDYVSHDLNDSYKYCTDSTASHPVDQFELVLRRWTNIIPGMEFRVFIKRNNIVAISQRHSESFFKYLLEQKNMLFQEIKEFYASYIAGRFADSDFVFDVVKLSGRSFVLIDFNPFSETTDALLYTWEELNDMDSNNEPSFRIITNDEGIQPSPYLAYSLPKDVVDLSCGEDINKMIDLINVNDLIGKSNETKYK